MITIYFLGHLQVARASKSSLVPSTTKPLAEISRSKNGDTIPHSNL